MKDYTYIRKKYLYIFIYIYKYINEDILTVTQNYVYNVSTPVLDKKTVRMRAEKNPDFLLDSLYMIWEGG